MMKNIINILLLLLVSFVINAQDLTRSGIVVDNASGFQSYGYYLGVAADSISKNQDTVYVDFQFGTRVPVDSYFALHFDAVTACSTSDSVKIEPLAKVLKTDSYASIGTAVYYQASADTTVTFTETSSADRIRFLRFRITYIGAEDNGHVRLYNSANAQDSKHIEVKLWEDY